MTRVTELTPLLKRLQLGPMAATLPERIALARREQLDYTSFLEIILSDEVNRRAHRRTELRLQGAGFEETCRPPGGLRLVGRQHPRPPPAGRRLLPGVPGQARARTAGGTRRSGQELHGPGLGLHRHTGGIHRPLRPLRRLLPGHGPGRVDNSVDRTFRSFLAPDLLILDDLGLHRLTAQQSANLHQLIISRHRVSSFVITSNRAVDEWLSLFDDPILGNSALDRLANASYRIVMEGSSYRERLSPHRTLLESKGVIDQPPAT